MKYIVLIATIFTVALTHAEANRRVQKAVEEAIAKQHNAKSYGDAMARIDNRHKITQQTQTQQQRSQR